MPTALLAYVCEDFEREEIESLFDGGNAMVWLLVGLPLGVLRRRHRTQSSAA